MPSSSSSRVRYNCWKSPGCLTPEHSRPMSTPWFPSKRHQTPTAEPSEATRIRKSCHRNPGQIRGEVSLMRRGRALQAAHLPVSRAIAPSQLVRIPIISAPGWLALAARLRVFSCQECQDLANSLKCRPNGSYIKPDRFGRTFVKLYLTSLTQVPACNSWPRDARTRETYDLAAAVPPTIGLC